jgi:hypothetical protein
VINFLLGRLIDGSKDLLFRRRLAFLSARFGFHVMFLTFLILAVLVAVVDPFWS